MQVILVLEMPTEDEVRASLRWGMLRCDSAPPWTPELVHRANKAARALLEICSLQHAGDTRRYTRPRPPAQAQRTGQGDDMPFLQAAA